MSLKAKAAAKTDVGLVRHKNQDSFGLDEELGLYVVCDGMGGAVGGEVASNLSVQSFLTTARQELELSVASNGERSRTSLWRAVMASNRAVRMRAAYDTQFRGMGTTLVAGRVDEGELTLINVGDSRAYLVREGVARQLTQDHSYVAESVRRGLMTEAQAENSAMQSVITRAIGAEDDVEPELFREVLQPGDAILLSSDGLTRHVGDEDIAEVLGRPGQSAMEGCRVLIEMAKDRGGSDNITCLVILMREDVMQKPGVLTHW